MAKKTVKKSGKRRFGDGGPMDTVFPATNEAGIRALRGDLNPPAARPTFSMKSRPAPLMDVPPTNPIQNVFPNTDAAGMRALRGDFSTGRNKQVIDDAIRGTKRSLKAPPASSTADSSAASAPVKKSAPRKAASSSDDFMADLRASAAKMKDATADMADKTGKMKASAEKFEGSFKKGGKVKPNKPKGYAAGGAVKSRGDGIAQRGRTKGRFV